MSNRGDFFAIGKAEWDQACDLGLIAAAAFLVLACGTGADNSTTSWSARAVEVRAGFSWDRSKSGIEALITAGLLERKSGKPPRYKLKRPEKLEDFIWLPNDIVTGAKGEPSPVARIRQANDVEILRMFVKLYAEQELAGDAGIARDLLIRKFERAKILEQGQFNVFGFTRAESKTAFTIRAFERFRNNGKELWERINCLEQLGLIEWADYLAEGENASAELIHALSGDAHAQDVADKAHAIAESAPDEFHHAFDSVDYVVPVIRHKINAAVVGIARLRYRPRTSKTSQWMAKHVASCEKHGEMYRLISEGDFAGATDIKVHQG